MAKLRQQIELKFEQFAAMVIRFHWIALILILGLVGGLGSQLRHIKIDTATESFLHETDPSLIEYNAFRDQFGRDEMIILMIQSDQIFSLSFMEKLKALHDELEENVPLLRDIDSLINVRSTRGETGELFVEDLLEELPGTDSEMQILKDYVLTHPLYTNLVISEDGKYTAIVIKTEAFSELETDSDELLPLTNEENTAIISSVEKISQKYQQDDFKIFMAGSPVVTAFLKESMQTDMKRFTGIAIFIIATFLFILFRRFSGVLLPLLTVIFSVVSTLGLMSLFKTSVKLPTMILPSFLLSIAVGASVHLIAMFFKHYQGNNKKAAIIWAFSHSGLPIMMTSLTTAAGLASFSTSKVAPFADLGIYSSIGVLLALLYTMILIPVLLSIFPVKAINHQQNKKSNRLDNILLKCGDLAFDHSWKVTSLAFIIFIIAMIGISRLEVTHDVLKWFPEGSIIRQNTDLIEKNLKGSVSMEVVVSTKAENGLYDPEVLTSIEKITNRATEITNNQGIHLVGKTVSLADILKEIHKALNANDDDYYKIPDNKNLIAQEFLLFENSGSDDLENQVDSLFSKTRITLKMPWKDAKVYVNILDEIKEYSRAVLNPDVKILITGLVTLMMETMWAMINSTIISYLIAGVVITILMILLLGNLKIGIVSMIPNLMPIIITLGFMGWANIQLDMFTLLIGSIAIGLAVDDTIHFFHNFRKYYEITGSRKKAIEETLLTAGKAMLVTTLVLATGFWIFMAATLNNLFLFGLLTGMTLVIAFLADVLLAPALLTIIYSKDKNRVLKNENPTIKADRLV
ncbi:MAG: MMPL family transporter [Deltaproteobacteria bacterium]|jgi:uncharacterized protein|nr:MMPL family transporter [Deltaproteobacteria bacterium]MBT4525367.1 MMPL family transporter [Deltaproteobacteria bacterium]